jgi:hypothetical protein
MPMYFSMISTELRPKQRNYSCKKFYNIGHRAQCYKTIYVCDLRMLKISCSVCGWQASLVFVGKVKSLLLSDKLQLYPIRLGWKDLSGANTLVYFKKFVNYKRKKFYNIGPLAQCYNVSSFVTDAVSE